MRVKYQKALDFFAVFWIILSTGSLVYCIFNMKISMGILATVAMIYIIKKPKIAKPQFRTMMWILGLVVLNGVVNIKYLELSDDIIILLIRLFSLAVICSCISKEVFMTNYCKILFGLCILSLICFLASEVGFTLPGQTTLWFKDKYYIYTLYHTIGRWTVFHRNAGIFWESPAFAIFINIAIVFLMLGKTAIQSKMKLTYFVIYSITVFSTIAITAYIEFFLILTAILIYRQKLQNGHNDSKTTRRIIWITVLVVAVVFLIRENSTHMIANKIFNHEGSYVERSNDTLQTFELALSRPLTGFGLFNNYTSEVLKTVDVNDNSNSFTTLLMYFGFPLFTIYLYKYALGIKKFLECSVFSFFLVFGAFILFLNSEQIAPMTLFLFFLFPMNASPDDRISREKEIFIEVKS